MTRISQNTLSGLHGLSHQDILPSNYSNSFQSGNHNTSDSVDPRDQKAEIFAQVQRQAQAAQAAAQELRGISPEKKSQVLHAVAQALRENSRDILAGNEVDVTRAKAEQSPLLDRLTLNDTRLAALADAVEHIADLPDPIGEVVRGYQLPNGLAMRQVRVPMGVIGMVYEARPNVTSDAFALAFKAGSAVLLRGSHSASHTNRAMVTVIQQVLHNAGLPQGCLELLPSESHNSVTALIQARGLVDMVIPRGGAKLIENVIQNATVPTVETGIGNCHIYVHHQADLHKAAEIIVNAKTRRPTVCNTVETVLIDAQISDWLPEIIELLQQKGVTIHGDEPGMMPATEADWCDEYLSLDLAIKIVPDYHAAIAHIDRYGTKHTECIITENLSVAQAFTEKVDAAAVMVNASTAFTDGEQFGFGAEMGISTQKMHARGPMALAELTTTKWIVWGDGQIRP